jgi:hypothetical protein
MTSQKLADGTVHKLPADFRKSPPVALFWKIRMLFLRAKALDAAKSVTTWLPSTGTEKDGCHVRRVNKVAAAADRD